MPGIFEMSLQEMGEMFGTEITFNGLRELGYNAKESNATLVLSTEALQDHRLYLKRMFMVHNEPTEREWNEWADADTALDSLDLDGAYERVQIDGEDRGEPYEHFGWADDQEENATLDQEVARWTVDQVNGLNDLAQECLEISNKNLNELSEIRNDLAASNVRLTINWPVAALGALIGTIIYQWLMW